MRKNCSDNRGHLLQYRALVRPSDPSKDPDNTTTLDQLTKTEFGNWHRNIPGNHDTNERLSRYAFEMTMRNLLGQIATISGRKALDASLFDVAKKTSELEAARKNSAENRQDIERSLLALKEHQSKRRHALDYFSQLFAIRNRAFNDLIDAAARLRVVAEGMSRTFGFSAALPSLDNPVDLTTKDVDATAFRENNDDAFLSGSSIDRHVIWARSAARFLVGMGQREQNYVIPLSLNAEANLPRGQTWNSKLKSSGDIVEFQFSLGRERFEGQSGVRLRGVSAVVSASPFGDIRSRRENVQALAKLLKRPSNFWGLCKAKSSIFVQEGEPNCIVR
jgi:hypothetical protein